MPIYLADQYGFNVKEIGLYAWFPYVGAMIGSLSGGWYVKTLMQKNSLDKSRKKVISIGALIIFSQTVYNKGKINKVKSQLRLVVLNEA